MMEVYRKFAVDYPNADFSEQAAKDMFLYESWGVKMPKREKLNGFELGKKWMDVTIAGWKEDIPSGGLSVQELLEDGFPQWFLERVGVFDLRITSKDANWWVKPLVETQRQTCNFQ